jgi:hypothetical protein
VPRLGSDKACVRRQAILSCQNPASNGLKNRRRNDSNAKTGEGSSSCSPRDFKPYFACLRNLLLFRAGSEAEHLQGVMRQPLVYLLAPNSNQRLILEPENLDIERIAAARREAIEQTVREIGVELKSIGEKSSHSRITHGGRHISNSSRK